MAAVVYKVIGRCIRIAHTDDQKIVQEHTTWPFPFEKSDLHQDAAWKARYAPKTLTRADLLELAEIDDGHSPVAVPARDDAHDPPRVEALEEVVKPLLIRIERTCSYACGGGTLLTNTRGHWQIVAFEFSEKKQAYRVINSAGYLPGGSLREAIDYFRRSMHRYNEWCELYPPVYAS